MTGEGLPSGPVVALPDDQREITIERFRILEQALANRGFTSELAFTEHPAPPANSRAFALEAIYVVVNSGMRFSVAAGIYQRCVDAVQRGASAATVFGHPGKARAIDTIWRDRRTLFRRLRKTDDVLAFCAELPFIGPVTKYHLAKICGGNFVKPDVHIARLADAGRVTPWELCHRLAATTGYREATIDSVLWRACAEGLLDSRLMRDVGWDAATAGLRLGQR